MNTFTVYGDTYPLDSIYAETMAQSLQDPFYSASTKAEWELYRDFAKANNLTVDQMEQFITAKDDGYHTMILGRAARTQQDLVIIANRILR